MKLLQNSHIKVLLFAIISIIIVFACKKNVRKPKISLLSSNTKIIAHRGYWCDTVPQNSLLSIQKAIDMQVYGAEIDIRMSKDSQLIVCHDAITHSLKIKNTMASDLCSLNIGNNQFIPLLKDCIKLIKQCPKFLLVLDLKNIDVNVLIRLIEAENIKNQIMIISYSLEYTTQLLTKTNYPTFLLQDKYIITPELLAKKGYRFAAYHHSILNSTSIIQESKKNKLLLMTYVINSIPKMEALFNINIDFILTDITLWHYDNKENIR